MFTYSGLPPWSRVACLQADVCEQTHRLHAKRRRRRVIYRYGRKRIGNNALFFADYYKYPLIPLGFSSKIMETQGHLSAAAHFLGWNLQSGNRNRKAAVVIFAQKTDFEYAGAFVMRK